ncbi:MAG: SDR family oxidoreductase [Cytophaga sp.]|nr:SDR family oxidoreductase [Undibacterium sp.]
MTHPDHAPVVIVTGAAGGIGMAMTSAFEAAGWRVVTTDQHPLARVQHVVGDMAQLANPEDPEAISLVANLLAATQSQLKALVLNAAHQVVKPTQELSAADWQATLNVNLLAPFWLTHSFLAELQANQGSMLAISSIHEKLTKPGFVAYATSKAALSGMVRAMAVDLGGRVRCNALCPAAIATPMLKAGFEGRAAAYQQLEAHHPSGRVGTPEEVAQTALFMCSDQAAFMNGSCVDLSGGISARLHDPV